jgi:hypothetical protein
MHKEHNGAAFVFFVQYFVRVPGSAADFVVKETLLLFLHQIHNHKNDRNRYLCPVPF